MRNLKRLAVWLTMTALLFCLSFTAFAAVEDTGFSDVDAGAWYAEAVAYVQEHGIMNGTTSTAFSPDATTTRGQMAAILYRAAGSPAGGGDSLAGFSDVADSAYYAQAVR
ncbi:MAG: S-layer homology domain-containing protein [Oscillibacter sp.]|nr:S-layer homology domain-containing protein [Oscillibacter sp.]